MQLKNLLDGIYLKQIPSSFENWDIQSISTDSRKTNSQSLFVALVGTQCRGQDFIPEVIQKGTRVIVTSPSFVAEKQDDILYLSDENPYQFLRKISQKFYDCPSEKIKIIGITGTNGKTTVAYLIESIFRQSGQECGLIGTIEHRLKEKILEAKNTTPGFIENQKMLFEMAQKHIPYCAMEVSSHALDQGRVDGLTFTKAVFTNLTQDHLDYHKDMENYFSVKSKLFKTLPPNSLAIINNDDPYGEKLLSLTEVRIMTYGIENPADITARNIKSDLSGMSFEVLSPRGNLEIQTHLIGRYNVSNILAAVAVCLSEDLSLDQIQKGISAIDNIPGRLEKVSMGCDFSIFIDYAHTEDALENVLKTLKEFSSGKILLVFGCGGDRDQDKRSKMGQVASQWADFSFVTTDNPRNEDPQAIIDKIVSGFTKKNYKAILERDQAIQEALTRAQSGDIVLLAGKGHETYQVVRNQRIHFDEREIIRNFF